MDDLSDLAAELPDAVVLISSVGEVRWGNRAAERLFGLGMHEAVGRNITEYLHPEDVQIAALAVASVQTKEVGSLLEVRVRSSDGWRLVEVRGAPRHDHIVLAIRDITDRRRWEVSGDEVARVRALIQNGTSIKCLLDADGTVRASSAVITRLLGHDQETLEHRAFAHIVAEKDHPRLHRTLDGLCASPTRPITVDLGLRTRAGGAIPFAVTFTNLLDDPTLEGIVVTGHDISDRVATETALHESNSLLATTLESTADGILAVDNAGRICSYNHQFATMWRIPLSVLTARDDGAALACTLVQVCEPEPFLQQVRDLYATPHARSHDVVHFTDGRVFERDSLPRRIGDEIVGRVWSFRDVTEHERLKTELNHRALHDALTGLPNRTLFRDRIEHAVDRLQRHGQRIAVLFIDLDNFKNVNDTLGHWAGDALLIEICRRLVAVLRREDTAARLGGDEFAVLIDAVTDFEDARNIAQRIIDSLAEPVLLAGRALITTASIGIAYGTPTTNADEMLRDADLAMYAAKADGKDCHRVFDPAMHAAAVDRLHQELDAVTTTQAGRVSSGSSPSR